MRTAVYIAAAVLANSCRGAPEPPRGGPWLHLEEEFTIALPDSAPVIGVVGDHAGRLVAWSQRDAYLLSATDSPSPLPVRFAGVPVGAGFGADGGIEFVDPAASNLRRSTPRGELAGPRLPQGLRVLAAVRSEEAGWIVAGVGEEGHYRIQPLDGDPWWTIQADTLANGVLPPYRLGLALDGVLLTEAEAPFRTWRVRSEGPGQPFAPTSSGYPKGTGTQRWVSAPVIDLGEAFVQTLADLGSDRRVLVLFDRDGREQRKAVLGVPMAVVGVTRDHRHVVSVRDVGTPEVVLYRWRAAKKP